MTDLYAILEVSPSASSSQIKSAYRRLARKFHPDVSASPDANANFARINEAYHILCDPKLRASYDRGEYGQSRRTFYASRAAEVVALQREFDRMVDEMLDYERQETAARSHAVLLVVPLFLSSFYVMVVQPPLIGQLGLMGRVLVFALAVYGLLYLIKNLSVAFSRYTYHVPDHLMSVFSQQTPRDKPISRRAGLTFLLCGYLVSLGLGYVVGNVLPLRYEPSLSARTLLSVFVYPPIAVLLVGSVRRIGAYLNRF